MMGLTIRFYDCEENLICIIIFIIIFIIIIIFQILLATRAPRGSHQNWRPSYLMFSLRNQGLASLSRCVALLTLI